MEWGSETLLGRLKSINGLGFDGHNCCPNPSIHLPPFSSVLGQSMLFSTLVMREDGQTSQWAEMFKAFRDIGMILTWNCSVHQYPALSKSCKSDELCFVSVFWFSECPCPEQKQFFILDWLFWNRMLGEVFISYKSPSSHGFVWVKNA